MKLLIFFFGGGGGGGAPQMLASYTSMSLFGDILPFSILVDAGQAQGEKNTQKNRKAFVLSPHRVLTALKMHLLTGYRVTARLLLSLCL